MFLSLYLRNQTNRLKMSAEDKTKQKKVADSAQKEAKGKKLSQFGRAMRKYRGWGEIVDMKAVLK